MAVVKAVTRAAEDPRPVLCARERGTEKEMKRWGVGLVGKGTEGWEEEGLCE